MRQPVQQARAIRLGVVKMRSDTQGIATLANKHVPRFELLHRRLGQTARKANADEMADPEVIIGEPQPALSQRARPRRRRGAPSTGPRARPRAPRSALPGRVLQPE